MSLRLFQLVDQVQERWPKRPVLRKADLAAPPDWALEAACSVVGTWSRAEYLGYRRQLPQFVLSLNLLYRNWLVATGLALLLSLVVVISGTTSAALNEANTAILVTVTSVIAIPPFAICYGIARDQVAAQALLSACSLAIERPTSERF